MADLLDANVWLALCVPNHVHHARALQYWRAEAETRAIGCRATAQALLRLLTNPHVVGDEALDGAGAWSVLQQWQTRGMEMGTEPAGVDDLLARWAGSLDIRGRQWTDAYLAAFAMAGGHRLVSFDKDFHRYPELHWLHLR